MKKYIEYTALMSNGKISKVKFPVPKILKVQLTDDEVEVVGRIRYELTLPWWKFLVAQYLPISRAAGRRFLEEQRHLAEMEAWNKAGKELGKITNPADKGNSNA